MSIQRKSTRDPNRCPSHPGALFRDIVLGETKIKKSEFILALDISQYRLRSILNEERPVTAELAVRFGHVLGNGPELWLGMQRAHDLWHAERKIDLSKLKSLPKSDIAA
jgi:antitoxin HigA-1